MQHEIHLIFMIAGALCLLVGLLGGLGLAGNRSPSTSARTAWLLLGLVGVAAMGWALTGGGIGGASPASANSSASSNLSQPSVPISPPTHPDALFVADSAFAACVVPTEPTAVPDGATASIEEMRTGRASVAAFDATTNTYLACLDSTVSQLAQQRQGTAAAAGLQLVRALGVKLHNDAVEKDQVLADRMNHQIRIYKAGHGPSPGGQ
ncbi:MAG TPA: hypothetical protein VGF89_03990 [Steroidobacteraceae bacterium]|jgi:hypothetical protein